MSDDRPASGDTRRELDRVDGAADLDRVFDQAPAVAVAAAAQLVTDTAAEDRPGLLREAAARVARLVYVEEIDGQYALDALSAAASRVGMTHADIDQAIAAGFASSDNPADAPTGEAAGSPYTIDEVDAAMAGFLFAEAWEVWGTGRTPCYPADTLRIACAWEGLPTLGEQDRRSGPRRPTPYIEAPGEELVYRDVWESWSPAQRDAWYLSRHERAATAASDAAKPRESTPVSQSATAEDPRHAGTGPAHPPQPVRAGTALNQPVDSDALVRALLEVLQSGRTIDRAEWDATVTTLAERSATTQPIEDDTAVAPHPTPPPPAQSSNPTPDDRHAEPAPHRRSVEPDTPRPVEPGLLSAAEKVGTEAEPAEHLDDPPASASADQPELPIDLSRQTALPPMVDTPPERAGAPLDPQTSLDGAIADASAAVARLAASLAADRSQSPHDPPGPDLHSDRPAYWAQSEVEL